MIRTEAAIVRAAVFDGGVVAIRHLGRLDEDLPAAAVILNIVGEQDTLEAMFRAAFEHEDVAVFKDDFGVDAAEAGSTDGDGGVVKEVRAGAGRHGKSFLTSQRTDQSDHANSNESKDADCLDDQGRSNQEDSYFRISTHPDRSAYATQTKGDSSGHCEDNCEPGKFCARLSWWQKLRRIIGIGRRSGQSISCGMGDPSRIVETIW